MLFINIRPCRRFHKDQRFLPAIDLAKENVKSATQNFLSIHKTIKNVSNNYLNFIE